ncbi:NAD(P)-binding protein [Leucogyrophana mollusca]|uniref:NAD(P)-binding protein n=1 Tax=Leucogyrophana mollusca TaxID=85980 RepID=A0ACB8B3I3_9AGAM|nr:NAD(P)-binding protein [Leucogyrophana mollusca]
MTSQKVWFITGASSGFGLSMAELVLARGDIAVATARIVESLSSLASSACAALLVLQLDVTKQDQVASAFAHAKQAFGRIDFVYNNAGQSIIGEVECVPDRVARDLFEVNFWGAVNVSKEAVRFFREENPRRGGTLLQVSSQSGMEGSACEAHYSASKFALEGFTESLKEELEPAWNIKILIVQPGWTRTRLIPGTPRLPSHPAYMEASSVAIKSREMMTVDALHRDPDLLDVDDATRAIYDFAHTDGAVLRLPLGKDSIAATKRKLVLLKETLERCEM